MKKKAILLVRVSTDAQDLDEQSLELKNRAIADGYKKSEIEAIEEKESGLNLDDDERRGLNRMKDCIESNPIETVYVWELSRLSRLDTTLTKWKKIFVDDKIQFICLNPSIKLLDEHKNLDPNADLSFNIFMSFAKVEMMIKKERTKRTKTKSARNEKYVGGYIKFGYYVDYKDEKRIKIKEDESAIVKLIFDLYESGLSHIGVARELGKLGYVDINNTFFVRNILISEEYTGKREAFTKKFIRKKDNKEYEINHLERNYPVIIDPNQFKRCREIALKNNTNANKSKNIYFGHKLVKCDCGRWYIANITSGQYSCVATNMDKDYKGGYIDKACNYRIPININVIDSLLWYVTKNKEAEFTLRDKQEQISNNNKSIEELQSKIAAISKRYDDIKNERIKLFERARRLKMDDSIFEKEAIQLEEAEKQIEIDKVGWEKEIERLTKLNEDIENQAKILPLAAHVKIASDNEKVTYLINELSKIEDDNIIFDLVHKHIKEVIVKKGINEEIREITIHYHNNFKSEVYFYKLRDSGLFKKGHIFDPLYGIPIEKRFKTPFKKKKDMNDFEKQRQSYYDKRNRINKNTKLTPAERKEKLNILNLEFEKIKEEYHNKR